MKFQQEGTFKYYNYLEEMVNYILAKLHSVISNSIKLAPHHRCFLTYILFLENAKIYVEGNILA